jgi:[acyl-carrier-protein] S-malonyltransferase
MSENATAPGSNERGGCVVLCPGQGAQAVGMGRRWVESSPAAREVFEQADAALAGELGAALSAICFEGPPERLNRTDISQPAIYTCSVACWRGLQEREGGGDGDPESGMRVAAAAGLSLGEYTALHLAGAFDFLEGLRLVATRGRLMQEAAEASQGSMVALVGADELQAAEVCERAASEGEVLVPANLNAPGQIVLSGHASACRRAAEAAAAIGLKAAPLAVAGAFHSPLMAPAAERMAEALATADLRPLRVPVWSNVTAGRHDPENLELLRQRLVEQIVRPVLWAQSCLDLVSSGGYGVDWTYHELAPGSVLRGLMRRIDREIKVVSHDEP